MIRKIHLLLGLFLAPWVVMYAASTIAMQHRELFTGSERRIEPEYKIVAEMLYKRNFEKGANSDQAAEQILKELDLEGAYRTRGNVEKGSLEILRDRPIGSYRITWDGDTSLVTVEKQGFGLAYYLEMLHRRRGFQQPFWANDAWAVIVDLVILAIIAWAFTGLWMWWNMKSTRSLGALFMVLGTALFAFLLATI